MLKDKKLEEYMYQSKLNVSTTTGGPYTYSQSAHHFYGVLLYILCHQNPNPIP